MNLESQKEESPYFLSLVEPDMGRDVQSWELRFCLSMFTTKKIRKQQGQEQKGNIGCTM